MIKINQLILILMSTFPLLTYDFLPWNLIWMMSFPLILRLFFHWSKFIILPYIFSGSYYAFSLFQFKIIPESTISFLAFMCLGTLLQKKEQEDRFNRLIALLWSSCFILFQNNLSAMLLSIFTTIIILQTFHLDDDHPLGLKDLKNIQKINLKKTFIALISIILLFIFFPRFYNFLPGVRHQTAGKIGYSRKVNNSQIGQLTPSSQIAFIAQIKQLANEQLYWRGSASTYTDGYNWKPQKIAYRLQNKKATQIKGIEYQIKFEQDFQGDIILLDTPLSIVDSNLRFYHDKANQIFRTYNKEKKALISARSHLQQNHFPLDNKNKNYYLQLPGHITPALKPLKYILATHKDLSDFLQRFKTYLQQNEFTYTLKPKRSLSLKDFLENKEGFCTHFASLLGISLRLYGYPTRLISGFQGGTYNEIGQHYTVRSNDAHAWVEVYNNDKWQRIDPTSYIQKERILRGGEGFITGTDQIALNSTTNPFEKAYYQLKQQWDNLNYKVSLFIDTYDKDKQRSLANLFQLNRRTFIAIGLFILMGIVGLTYFMLKLHQSSLPLIDQYFNKFCKKLNKHHIDISKTDTLKIIKQKIARAQISQAQKKQYNEFLELYERTKYSEHKNLFSVKESLKQLK